MKKLILAAAIAVSSMPVFSADCNGIANLASSIMEVRQQGVSMRKVIAALSDDKGISDIAMAMVKDAYDRPQFGTDKYQAKEIVSFEDVWFKACLAQDSK